jgi:hypothetical protein
MPEPACRPVADPRSGLAAGPDHHDHGDTAGGSRHPRAGGAESITRQGHLRLPAHIRHTCRLNPGDRLLTAAAPRPGVLVIYTMPLLEWILAQHHAAAPSGEGPR